MDYYFLVITIMDVFALGIMCIHTKYSETLSQQKRNWFIRSFALIIVISVLEVITIVVPYLSVGSASFMAGDNVLEVKETADNDMYQFKKTRKTQAN